MHLPNAIMHLAGALSEEALLFGFGRLGNILDLEFHDTNTAVIAVDSARSEEKSLQERMIIRFVMPLQVVMPFGGK